MKHIDAGERKNVSKPGETWFIIALNVLMIAFGIGELYSHRTWGLLKIAGALLVFSIVLIYVTIGGDDNTLPPYQGPRGDGL